VGRFLCIGGAGFIGSHLCDALVERGADVLVLDDLSNGTKANLKDYIKEKTISFNKGDIAHSLFLNFDYKIDGIFHLACWPRSLSLADPDRDVEVNALGTIHALELARKTGAKVVFTSNSGIYGNPEYLPIDEKHPDKPSTPYDANKLVSEYYMKIYHRIYGVPIAICRLATVYGPRQRIKPGWAPVIPEFATKLSKGEAPTIYWDGEQTRDLIYVKDVVQGLIKAYEADTGDETYILSTGVETSINQIYRTVAMGIFCPRDIQPRRAPMVPGDIRRMLLSYAKAEARFGFKPEYTLEQGIENYLTWFKGEK
jgi:UDP-glucose 4-epimerase